MSSQKQIDANRANALKSTGPKTPEGKAAVRLNALQHGLTAQDAVLSFENREQFDAIRESYEQHYQPVGPVETFLVQQVVMSAWRLGRIRGMETSAFDLGLSEDAERMAEEFNDLSDSDRLTYVFRLDARCANTFTILARYETRAERAFFRAHHELLRLQASRAKQSQSAPLAPAPSSSFVPSCLSGDSLLPPSAGPLFVLCAFVS